MILAAIVSAFVFFWGTLVELGQFWFGGRVPTFSDTIAQTIGGILGTAICLVGGNWFLSRVGAFVSNRREAQTASIALELYLAGYAFWALMPFLPALTPSVLAERWRRGAIDPFPFGDWTSDPMSASYNAAVALVAALPIGLYFGRKASNGDHSRASLLTGLLGGGLFVAILEMLQVFIESRTASADDLIWSVAGASLGVIGVQTISHERNRDRKPATPQTTVPWV